MERKPQPRALTRAPAARKRPGRGEADFAVYVTHDLRAPLQTILGFASLLLDEQGDRLGDEGRSHVRRIVAATSRMARVIEEHLEIRGRTGRAERLEVVALGDVVQEALSHVEEAARRRDARFHVEQDLPSVLGHRSALVRVLTNLLGNAVRYTPSERQPRVCIRAERSASSVRLFVEDNGVGLPAGTEEKVFELGTRFHADRFGGGTGVGLALVRDLVEQMGGSAGASRRDAGGSSFWIELVGVAARL